HQSIISVQIGAFDGNEFYAQLAQRSKISALFIFGPIGNVPYPNGGKLPRARPDVWSIGRGRIARICTMNRGQNQAAVVNVAANRTDLVERPTKLHAAVSAYPSIGRSQSHGAADDCRTDETSRGFGADREANEPRGGGHGWTGRGPRGVFARI